MIPDAINQRWNRKKLKELSRLKNSVITMFVYGMPQYIPTGYAEYLLWQHVAVVDSIFHVGAGMSDMTGPSNDIVFMGYANSKQVGSGIHLPLQSRAFVIQTTSDGNNKDESNDDNNSKLVGFVSVDIGMASDIVKTKVIEKVNTELGKTIFTYDNLCVSGTHTHSGPGGYIQYVLYQASTYGFVNETFQAWVNGISASLIIAYYNREPARILINQGKLDNTSINRSPTSYLLNPQEEIQEYEDQGEGDTDKNMLILKFVSVQDPERVIGVLNWFAVHGTSMNNTNTLVSGDNKGYASYMLEREMNGKKRRRAENDTHDRMHRSSRSTGTVQDPLTLGKSSLTKMSKRHRKMSSHNENDHSSVTSSPPPFVAAFASSNLGDVSPNIQGAKCIDTGLPCDGVSSSCNGRCELCIAAGPGRDMFESTQIIGDRQYRFAKELMNTAVEEIKDNSVDYRHSFVNMPELEVDVDLNKFDDHIDKMISATAKQQKKKSIKLCSAAFGYAFGAGTTDGPGMFDFTQGTTSPNLFWRLVTATISRPTVTQKHCHHPKPILLNLGDMSYPYAWVPSTMPFQLFRIGNLFIISTSTELTTMAGRRLRKAIKAIIVESKVIDADEEVYVVIAGLANSYQSYTSTYKEYQGQRYEAASTMFGPHQLDGMIQEYSRITHDMVDRGYIKQVSDTDAPPADLLDKQWEFAPKPKLDKLPPCHRNDDSGSSHMNDNYYKDKTNSPHRQRLLREESGSYNNMEGYSHNNIHSINSDKSNKCIPHYFGEVVKDKDVKTNMPYKQGERVSVTFYGANPRHLPPSSASTSQSPIVSTRSSFLTVERLLNSSKYYYNNDTNKYRESIASTIVNNNYDNNGDDDDDLFELIADDRDWSTQFHWSTSNSVDTSTTNADENEDDSNRNGNEIAKFDTISGNNNTTTKMIIRQIKQNDNTNDLVSIGGDGVVSCVTLTWYIPLLRPTTTSHHVSSELYRLCYHGYAKTKNQKRHLFTNHHSTDAASVKTSESTNTVKRHNDNHDDDVKEFAFTGCSSLFEVVV